MQKLDLFYRLRKIKKSLRPGLLTPGSTRRSMRSEKMKDQFKAQLKGISVPYR